MKTELALESWNRREHFYFFSQFEEPFFSLVTNVDVAMAYSKAKTENLPFYLYYLYLSLVAANKTEAFRYRIEEDKVICYDAVHATPTVLRDDHTFGISFLPYQRSFAEFVSLASSEIQAVKDNQGLCLTENTGRPDVIHYSSVPWITFTGLTHARRFTFKDSIPKISFGKYFKEQNKLLLPVSITVHHGLMDGFHVGEYLMAFQELLDQK